VVDAVARVVVGRWLESNGNPALSNYKGRRCSIKTSKARESLQICIMRIYLQNSSHVKGYIVRTPVEHMTDTLAVLAMKVGKPPTQAKYVKYHSIWPQLYTCVLAMFRSAAAIKFYESRWLEISTVKWVGINYY
jgi:hypothetical protein